MATIKNLFASHHKQEIFDTPKRVGRVLCVGQSRNKRTRYDGFCKVYKPITKAPKSWGHAGFVSVGGVCVRHRVRRAAGHGLSDLALLLVAILAGGLAAGLMGIAVGIPALRLRGDYLAIVTMAFAEIIRVCFCNFSITGGGKTMSGILKLSRV